MAFLALKLDILDLEYAEVKRRRKEGQRLLRRHICATQLLDTEFVATYRLTKIMAADLIQELSPFLPSSRGDLNFERKILIGLSFLASGSDQRSVGQIATHAFSQPSSSRAINQVVEALNHPTILQKYVKFPGSRQERNSVKNRFFTEFGLPGVVGCVDGSHIAIIRPEQNEENFFNRKHFHSLNVQIICDADLYILSVDASHGGSAHDSAVWGNHPLNAYLQSLYAGGETVWLLGDSGYPQRETLMTPIVNADPGTPEARYTETHVRARNCVERCLGVLKARWRCLSSARRLHYTPLKCAKIVNACVVLHNIAHRANLPVPQVDPESEFEERRVVAELEARQESAEVLATTQSQRRVSADLVKGRVARAALIRNLEI